MRGVTYCKLVFLDSQDGLECANAFQMVPNAHHCVPTEARFLL